jgi:DNA-binding NarL/FixJ family response regulator
MSPDDKLGSDFVSIVVADRTRIHTQLLADALRSDPALHVVAQATNSSELLAAASRVPIDVVVISHNLDNQPGHGTQVLREMRALRPQIRAVILLDSSNPQEVLECFRAGARGIFSEQEGIETLCKCIRNVHEGQIWARSVDLDHALAALAKSPVVRATNHQGLELLSLRERQVIQHVAGGLSNREIAEALKLSPHTVKNYLFRIFDKLGVSSRTELLYLTMNNSQAPHPASNGKDKNNDNDKAFAAVIEAAEAGDPAAQLLMAEHFSQIKDVADGEPRVPVVQSASVSACMWYLLAEKTATLLLEQVATGKQELLLRMSPQQLAEAESRAASWSAQRRERPSTLDRASPDHHAVSRHPRRKLSSFSAKPE